MLPTTLASSLGPSLRRRIGYAIGIVGPMLGWVATNQYLLFFYTEVLRLPAATAGLIFGIAMVWDAAIDPALGWLSDRTRTRWGRYRAWLLWAAVPYAISLPLVFSGLGADAGPLAVAIALATNLLFRTLYSAVYMPYTAMLAAISSGYDERTAYTTWKTAFVFAANLLVSFGFLTVVLATGGETVRGFAIAGAIFGAVAAACILLCFRATRGMEQAEPLNTESIPRGLVDLGRDRAFIVLFLGVMTCGGFGAIMTASTAYVAKYWLGDTGATRWLFTIQALAALASIPLWSIVARRWSKRATWVAGACLSSAAMIAARLIEPTTALGLVPFYAVTQVGYTAFIIVFFAMTADVCDWNQARSGRRHEGVAFGAIAFANQLAAGLAGIVVGALFGWIGIGAAAAQPVDESARQGLLNVGLLLPAAGFALTALIVAAYPVSRRAHAEALAAIRARAV